MNVTLCGNRVSADVTKLKSYWSRVGHKSNDCRLYKRKRGDLDTETRGNKGMKKEAETGGMQIQVKGNRGLPGATRR